MKQGVPRTTGNSLFFLHCKIADCNSEEGRKLRFTSLNLHTTSQTDTYYGEAMAAIRAGEAGVIRINIIDGKLLGAAEVEVKDHRG